VAGRRIEHQARLSRELLVAVPHEYRQGEPRQGLEGEGGIRQLERQAAGGRCRPAESLEPEPAPKACASGASARRANDAA